MKISRRKSRVIKIGKVKIGGNNPVAIQSMTKTKTSDLSGTLRQIKELEKAGCEVVRLAIKNSRDSRAIKKIRGKVSIPIVADIHFNWKLALEAIDNGVDKIRLNPGNINKRQEIGEIVAALKSAKIPLRIGVNSGSVTNALGAGKPGARGIAQLMVKSALDYIRTIEKLGFYDIVVSLKGSNIFDTIEANRRIAKLCDYPLHLGVTATGLPYGGAIKSSIALGALLLEGIGDTIRISLTDRPQAEIEAAKAILGSLGLRFFGPEVISCPTCGRCQVDLVNIVKELESRLATGHWPLTSQPLKVAVMGCEVNGPGEARQADIGIAFGKDKGLLFKRGAAVEKVSGAKCIDILLKEMEKENG